MQVDGLDEGLVSGDGRLAPEPERGARAEQLVAERGEVGDWPPLICRAWTDGPCTTPLTSFEVSPGTPEAPFLMTARLLRVPRVRLREAT